MNADRLQQIDNLIVPPDMTLKDALRRLDQAGTGALVLCRENLKLIGLLTDGDIRRALLRGTQLDTPCGDIANHHPVLGIPSLSKSDALQMMMQREIDQLPLVDEAGFLQDILLRKELVAKDNLRIGMADRLNRVIVRPERTIAEAIAQLDAAGTGALVVSSRGMKLEGLLSDGDIRRAVLRGISLDDPCGSITKRDPFTALYPLSNSEALKYMLERDINQLPVVDSQGNLFDFLLRRDLADEKSLNLSAVIMAGGFGKRLTPLTEQVPKPMLPVGDRPLLERTIARLREAGVRDVHLTTHYLSENIENYFGDGEKYGVRLGYAQEDHPLGTAGGLRLLPRPTNPFVVLNGDILTGVSFQEMLQFHQEHKAELTVGVRKYDIKVPFGVVECEDAHIVGLREKPSLTFFINAGIYLLEPTAYDYIPEGERFDMTDLIDKLIHNGSTVVSFPIIEYWLDIGQHEDYKKAQEDFRNGKI